MINRESIYILKREYLRNICETQFQEFISDFSVNKNGDIKIPYTYKGYSCNEQIPEYSKSVQAISFFSGCGGLDIGTQLAGVKVLSGLDFFEDSVKTMAQNRFFEHTEHFCEDINNVNGKTFSDIIKKNNPEKLILVGGPPCQPFSKAGYWVTNENRKANGDPRNMIGSYFRLISEIKPDGFVLENVESILHPTNKEAVDSIVKKATALGHHFSMLKMNAADYGIPQRRKRVFFIATKKKIDAKISPTHGDVKDILENPKLNLYERAIDWIAPFDHEEFWFNEPISSEGKYEYELTCIPPGKNYIALSEKAGHPNPVFMAG